MQLPNAENVQINPFWVHGLADDGSSAIHRRTRNHLAARHPVHPQLLGPNLGLTVPFAGSVLYMPLPLKTQKEILEGAVSNAPDNLDVIVHSQGHLAAAQVFSKPEYADKARQLILTAPVVDPRTEWQRIQREAEMLDAGETLQLAKDELIGRPDGDLEDIELLGVDVSRDLDTVIRFPHPRDPKAVGCYAALTGSYLKSLEQAAKDRDGHLERMAQLIGRPTTSVVLAQNEAVTDARPDVIEEHFDNAVDDLTVIVMPGADHRLYRPGIESARQYTDFAQLVSFGAYAGALLAQDSIGDHK